MHCNIGILDSETDYANQLMDYMKRNQKKLGMVRVFTSVNSLKEYVEENELQILLLHEAIIIEDISNNRIKHICYLSEENHKFKENAPPLIYKYQAADTIIKELLLYFPPGVSWDLEDKENNTGSSVVCVYSLDSQTLKQKFALSLASLYAKNRNTLYLDFNFYQALPELKGDTIDKGFSDIIYYLKENSSNLFEKINEMKTRVLGLDYISGVTFAPDLLDLHNEDFNRLLKVLRKEGKYEIIIFDIGFVSQAVLELFKASSELLYIREDLRPEDILYKDFLRQIAWAGYGEITEKIKEVLMSSEEVKRLKAVSFNPANDLNGEEVMNCINGYVNNTF